MRRAVVQLVTMVLGNEVDRGVDKSDSQISLQFVLRKASAQLLREHEP